MKKTKLYKYIGYNGVITSPILLEGIAHKTYYRLDPENGKILTNGEKKVLLITVPEEEVQDWYEV